MSNYYCYISGSNKDSSSVVSPDLGVGSEVSGGQGHSDPEVAQIKERLLQKEAELQEALQLAAKTKVRGRRLNAH